ncbi:leucine--tRNA ligase [Candidatus Pacearchaeota archaeon]|nr:leucine--tRNA ligase [Candidatus Pacearchaeota archaeon]
MSYNFKKLEAKWQRKWESKKIFEVKEDGKKGKFYVLEMYPYPSASGLHMGHAFNYTIGDILARFKRMRGLNVLHPTGFDSFGLPAENAAIKNKSHPKIFTDKAIKNYIKQMKMLGLSYDWKRMLMSHDPEYYKWNQWIFLKMFERGLVYRKKAPVNFCPKCDTVLANEQVHNGKCWRHQDTDVVIKNLEQWFIKTTKYSEELLNKVDSLDWPERIKIMQKNWIGKSQGVEIEFEINKEKWKIFTTRPDTLFGITFMVVSAQHSKLMDLVTKEQKNEVEKFLEKIKSTREKDIDVLEKEGVFTGSYALHPITKEKIPVYAGNFVVADYGFGMVMAVPAHDQRDFDFAKKYKLPIKEVISGGNVKKEAYVGFGKLINSSDFNGLTSDESKEHITKTLEFKKLGRRVIQYKFRDWLVSRQRYWGTPIPIIYCNKCGIQGVKEKDLPVKLPEKVKFGKGNPLETNKKFFEIKCPKCKGKARRETDTMDTFFDSSWYYLRFCDSKNKKEIFDKKKIKYWMPVNFYTGGAEHACMHLIYARFFTKFLRDIKLLDFDEPFTKLFNQGMVHGEDKFVMSKSRGNIVDPTIVINKYGADILRFFLVSTGSPDKDFIWSENGIDGSYKFVNKLLGYFFKPKFEKSDEKVQSKINKTVKEVSADIENLKYNLAIIKIRNLLDYLQGKKVGKKELEIYIKLISPFAPHIAEELWERLGNKKFISLEKWPEVDESKINEKFEKEEEIIEKTIEDINNVVKIIKDKGKNVNKIYLYSVPNEFNIYVDNLTEIEKRTGLSAKIFVVNDKSKHDPENKSSKAKPGKPGIYLE